MWRTQMAVANGKLEEATELWGALEEGIGNATDNVDWYNVRSSNLPWIVVYIQ